jgi:hypothetical protein
MGGPGFNRALFLFSLLSSALFASCGKSNQANTSNCINSIVGSSPLAQSKTGSSGQALVFYPDPETSALRTSIIPNGSNLDQYSEPRALSNLGGRGVLEGSFVDVRDGLLCDTGYGAFDLNNNFQYSHSDPRFSESMSYYWGDQYRSSLPSSFLEPKSPVQIIAHCAKMDNAFFVRELSQGADLGEEVCLGDSVNKPGAYYGDDAIVTVHELEHATTIDNYSPSVDLNQGTYDEAGSLNEAISDFMSLVFLAPLNNFISPYQEPFDPRVFSRWALGNFISQSALRGAHRCPAYSAGFPECTNFYTKPFDAASGTVSYIYPDGMGWPYPGSFTGIQDAFNNFSSQEEIHNAGVLLEGALWDIYQNILTAQGGNQQLAESATQKIVLYAVANLPKPGFGGFFSPVTYRNFADQLVLAPNAVNEAWATTPVTTALTDRGLIGNSITDPSWLSVGPGTALTPGMKVQDSGVLLASWIAQLTTDPTLPALVTQQISSGTLGPGKIAALWFDVQNNNAITVGGPLLTITSQNPDVQFLFDQYGNGVNVAPYGPLQAQIRYIKINGTQIVQSLTSTNPFETLSIGNSYFRTNPAYLESWHTAVFVKVSQTATHGESASFNVQVTPSNGVASQTVFTTQIQ